MQDTDLQLSFSHQSENSNLAAQIKRQMFFQQMIQPSNIRNPFNSSESLLNLTSSARKLLETVLVNSNVNAVPQSKEEFFKVTLEILENSNKSDTNVAYLLRSMIDLVKYDNKLGKIILKHFGFSQETRIFHNALFKNLNNEADDAENIGIVHLKDFMIYFGLVYDLFLHKDISFFSQKLNNYETEDEDMLKITDNQQQASLISPLYSQQQLQEAKDYEASSIVKVFETTQLCSLGANNEVFDTTQVKWKSTADDQIDEDLIAREDLHIQIPQVSQIPPMQNIPANYFKYQTSSILNVQHQRINGLLTSNLLNSKEHNNIHPSYEKSDVKESQSNHQEEKQEEKIRYFPDLNFRFQPSASLLSNNNSLLNTPMRQIKDNSSHLYPNNSEFKSKFQTKLSFNANTISSQTLTPYPNTSLQFNKDILYKKPRALFQNPNTPNDQQNLSPPPALKSNKRQSSSIVKLEQQLMSESVDDGFSPLINKRTKSSNEKAQSLRSTVVKERNQSEEEEKEISTNKEGEEAGFNDNISSASRKKRGLKILSVKVQELVFIKKMTTYKDVANELIKQLRENKKKMQEFMDNGEFEDVGEDEYLSDESPTKKGGFQEGKDSNSQQKWEKNVRRRVYDALNVLYAAGRLKKEGKYVSCDPFFLQMSQNSKEQQGLSSNSKMNSASKSHGSSSKHQDQKMLQQIEILKHQLSLQKQRVDDKKEVLSDQFKHFIAYKNLVERNEHLKSKGIYDPSKSIQLPFILVSTKDSPDNEVEISYGDENSTLNIAMKKPMKCIGDVDTLIKLGFYKVTQDWFDRNMSEFSGVLGCISEKQRAEIII